ncbi:tumor necrosis factor alpha-induced protein 8-like isoform X2 [Mya arenaria]|uniref:tumor necrosis factor alpha-induced protein 8-like isoform X1 n=1 Tax=Mya arenaria TaxID=6604 RepID=UPI0022DFDF20|nr:tumor necrosis factor alpha-induced protein 8-like isoform X1 [Mya arenaria]XP_052796060.1 tumor necrosis factor alpha-induced protein 8-like isoform X1 [Mya arenaria]XP_052796061.1 tumor necrosis factor alpha-induced protein 8-like isoform X1 [Mya arenaria]XP_052796062.1 tumor necrosis factor alpha-induced protein 8-like isoform X1 [Mya arenaria]XP_052796063.1 tumor necrosis factor alpha-induced protein 8-like isoform X2 [Mya arenaria]
MASEPGAGFDSKGIGLRAQKKLLGKMSSKKIAKVFIDDTTARVLDNAFRILKEYLPAKKDADKILKYLIKTVVKIGILYRNDQFNAEELKLAELFKQKFRSVAMTLVSFYTVDFTYDKQFLRHTTEECHTLLQQLIKRHLTDKSKSRVDIIFDTFNDPALMDAIFTSGKFKEFMDKITTDLNTLMDEGSL